MTNLSLRIGLFGGGVVGGGVYELVRKYTQSARWNQLGISVEIVKICVLHIEKERDFQVNAEQTKFVTDYDEILEDSSINCVVELMGGTTNAKDVVLRAIRGGKHVITANKALIAAYLPEIQEELSKQPHVNFAYEAAVCGGIPIIHSLHTDFVADNITKIMGIMNGTTNFMLSKMEDEGADYQAVLTEAQRLGFAEADPTADVEGFDVQAKIALLSKLAFGMTIPVSQIPTAGISQITKSDFAYAKTMHSTIKLLGTAMINADGSIAVFVSPTLVPYSSPLSTAKGAGNMVVVQSENMVSSTFAGPGAGRYPTANSVLNDIVRLAQHRSVSPFPLETMLIINPNYQARFYVRIQCEDGLGIVRSVGEAAEQAGVSIHAILQNPRIVQDEFDFVVTTEVVSHAQIVSFAQAVTQLSRVKGRPFYLPML